MYKQSTNNYSASVGYSFPFNRSYLTIIRFIWYCILEQVLVNHNKTVHSKSRLQRFLFYPTRTPQVVMAVHFILQLPSWWIALFSSTSSWLNKTRNWFSIADFILWCGQRFSELPDKKAHLEWPLPGPLCHVPPTISSHGNPIWGR